MPTIKDQLRADLTTAMKARDETRTRTLRMTLTSISNEEVSGAVAHDLTDDEVIKILTREAKRRREAAAAFADAGREEQAAAERAEEQVLAGYLPAQLDDDELGAMVAAAIAETGASGPAGIGQVMKVLTPARGGPGRRQPGRCPRPQPARQLADGPPSLLPASRARRRRSWPSAAWGASSWAARGRLGCAQPVPSAKNWSGG